RTDEVADLTAWLGALVRQTDSSLLDERGLRVLVRNAMFRMVELVARRDAAGLVALHPDGPSEEDWAAQIDAYFAEYADLGIGPEARGPALLVQEGDEVAQILDDPEGDRDWRITATIDRM